MPAYIIARVHITDGEQYQHYLKAAPPIIGQYGGKLIARSEGAIALESPHEARRIVILQFPSVVKAKEFYHSPEYQNAKKLRKDAAVGELIVVEGFSPG